MWSVISRWVYRYRMWGTHNESLDSQVDRLANYIMNNIPGEPSQNQGAIDTAIRLLRNQYGG